MRKTKAYISIERTITGWWTITTEVRYRNMKDTKPREYVPWSFFLTLKSDTKGGARPFLREYMKENNLIFAE